MKHFRILNHLFVIICTLLVFSSCTRQSSENFETLKDSKENFSKKSSTTIRGKISGGSTIELTYSYNASGTTLTVQTSSVTTLPSDALTLHTVGIPIDPVTDDITIPNDGKKYWIIPFDNSFAPVNATSGTSSQICDCKGTGTGNCKMEVTKDGDKCTKECKLNTCTDECELKDTPSPFGGGLALPDGSAFIIEANTLIYNGVTYN